MPVLDRSELEASPLADLHAIADQLGLDGFRRLRKADLIDAILGEPGGAPDSEPNREESDGGAGEDVGSAGDGSEAGEARAETASRSRRRRSPRSRRSSATKEENDESLEDGEDAPTARDGARRARGRGARAGASGERPTRRERPAADEDGADSRIAEGVVELLGNGSAFLRVSPPKGCEAVAITVSEPPSRSLRAAARALRAACGGSPSSVSISTSA